MTAASSSLNVWIPVPKLTASAKWTCLDTVVLTKFIHFLMTIAVMCTWQWNCNRVQDGSLEIRSCRTALSLRSLLAAWSCTTSLILNGKAVAASEMAHVLSAAVFKLSAVVRCRNCNQFADAPTTVPNRVSPPGVGKRNSAPNFCSLCKSFRGTVADAHVVGTQND